MSIKLSFLLTSFLSLLCIVYTTLAFQQGFSTDLIHRDSPLSPLYTQSLNKYDRLRNSIHRTLSRIDRLRTMSSASPDDVQSQVKSSQGEYLMELSFGTPPVSQVAIVDTGSDLIWTQCQPCLECYKQDIPIFDPRISSTYKAQSCDSKACLPLGTSQFSCSRNNICGYNYQYGGGAHTTGDLATETITFMMGGHSVGIPEIIFGCGHDNSGTYEQDGSGLVGLGGGSLSLVSQLGSSISGKFSYCLVPLFKEGNYTSKINFGTNGEVSGPGVVSTPIVKNEFTSTFYYLTLEGVSVGTSKIPFHGISFTNVDNGTYYKGNIFIDSGTTLTFLPSEMYSSIISAMEKAIIGTKVKDPTSTWKLQLCYKTTKGGDDLNIPNVMAHFDGGDIVLKPSNMFVQVADGVVCLAIAPSNGEVGAILGNIAQMDFLIGYDLQEGKVSFKPTDCTKQ